MESSIEHEYDHLIYLAAADNQETRHFASALHLFGYEIKIFNDPETLAAAIAEREPHVLILDDDIDQGQLAGQASKKRRGGSENYPVIIISSNDNFENRLAAVRAGIDGYFIKPIDMAALSERIDEKISRRKIRAYRILTVDDDVLLSAFYEAVLNVAGMHVQTLSDPSKILEVLRQFQPELILMDIYMPLCTGAEVAKLIRQNNLYVDIPIVFLSSEENIDRQISALEIGAENFLTKPIEPENLISVVSSRAERYRALRKSGLT